MGDSKERSFRILLLCDDWRGHANTVLDHIESFRRLSRHDVRTFNPVGMRASVVLDLDEFDAVVIHYSLLLHLDRYVSPGFRDKLRRYRGLKIQFIQDEYRWVDRVTAASRDVGVNVLFTCAPKPAAGQLYDVRLPGVVRVETLTGYVPMNLQDRPRRPLAGRPLDVGYRGRDLVFWLGELSQEKAWIGRRFLERAPGYGLKVDIGWREADRIYGERWIDFISSCRATLGTESGASIADFDGSVEQAVKAYVSGHPDAPFDQVHDAVLRPFEGNVTVNVISPRVFEAAALGTALVMFPGSYSGIALPGRHYMVLEKDFSNMDEVVRQLKDQDLIRALVERTHEELIASRRWSYAAFIQQFDDVVSEHATSIHVGLVAARHRLAGVERAIRVPSGGMKYVARLLGWRRAIARTALVLRAVVADPAMRSVIREGLRERVDRGALLEEIAKFSLLRRAVDDRLQTVDPFSVTTEFDAETGLVCFVSVPAGADVESNNGSQSSAAEALRAGAVKAIAWDHRALGSTVRLRKPRLELGIGSDGFKSFALLSRIARLKPVLMERVLAPMVDARNNHASHVS